MMETKFESITFNTITIAKNFDEATFSKELFSLCLKKLFDFINEYQVKELPPEEIVKNKINDFNAINKTKLPKAEMLHFYRHLLKHGSFKMANKFSEHSRATLYRHKLRFALIGITEQSIKPIDKVHGIPIAPLDFRRYHNYLQDHHQILRGIKIPDLKYSW